MRLEELEGGEHPYLPGIIDVPTIIVPPDTPPANTPFEERLAWIPFPLAAEHEPNASVRDDHYDETNRPEFDTDRIMCAPVEPDGPGCASPIEVAEYLAQLADVDRTLAAHYEEETGLSTGRDDIDHLDPDEE